MDETLGVIFNVVHGSFVDGYGVRTTIFLKGCPLSCLWCCNPEGQKPDPQVKFIASLCNGCGKCIDICPDGVFSISHIESECRLLINRDLCTLCGKCVDTCYRGALEIIGKYMTVTEVMEIIKKDELFYRQFEGGVTIGGGEPTFQPEFTLALIRECKKNYIHTAVDTCGYTFSDEGFAVLKEADLLLFDVKCIDRKTHIENTGLSNEIILNNLIKLDKLRKPIIIRIPLIPNHNDSKNNLESTAAFLSNLTSIERVDIIPFHEYGKIKFSELGMTYHLNNISRNMLTQEDLNSAKQIFIDHGLNVQFGG